jgi:hypothetical protein
MNPKLRLWLLLALLAITLVFAAVTIGPDWLSQHPLSQDPPSYSTTNYSTIEDGLCLGGLLGEAPPGTRAVLNLCEHKDPYTAEVHRWQPIRDAAPAPSIDWLRQQVHFVDEQRRAGLPVYIHCAAGVSRAAMVMAAYLMARDGCSRDQALARIRAKRPIIGPNPAFMQLLLVWEDTLAMQKARGGPPINSSGR